ncbi:MAG: histidine kinase N-terminal 7TM domain-containing protein, partial [Patescibacteria group bacterium]|nr:histidine kinase N-terminal 7TM domain-containing protein [Patescibacteria group bacterium]
MDTTHIFASFASTIVFIAIIIAGLSNLGLGIYVYKNNPRKKLNRTFAVFAFINFLFCLINTINNLASEHTFWLRICYAVGTLVASGCFFLGIAVANIQVKKWIRIIIYLATGIMTLACLTPYVIKELSAYDVLGWQAEFGPLFIVWVIFTVFIFCLSVYLPLREIRYLNERNRKQFTYFVSGYFIFGTWSLLFGVIFPLFGFSSISNIDSPSTLFVTVFTSYAIIKYQLMDIKSLFFKAFVYSLIIAAICVILAVIVFLESWLYYNLGSSATYFIFLCVSIIIFLVGRSFYKKTK